MQATYRRPGWRNESYRHYLAAKGVRTGKSYYAKFVPVTNRASEFSDIAEEIPKKERSDVWTIADYQGDVGPSPGDEKKDPLMDSIMKEKLRDEIERAKSPVKITVESDNLYSYPPNVEARRLAQEERERQKALEEANTPTIGEQVGMEFERLKDWTKPKWESTKEWAKPKWESTKHWTAAEAQEAKEAARAGASKLGEWSDKFGEWSSSKWQGSMPQKYLQTEREMFEAGLEERKARQALKNELFQTRMDLKKRQQQLAFEKKRQEMLAKAVNPEGDEVLRMSDDRLLAGELNQRKFPSKEDYLTMRRQISEMRYMPESRVQQRAMEVAARQVLEGKV